MSNRVSTWTKKSVFCLFELFLFAVRRNFFYFYNFNSCFIAVNEQFVEGERERERYSKQHKTYFSGTHLHLRQKEIGLVIQLLASLNHFFFSPSVYMFSKCTLDAVLGMEMKTSAVMISFRFSSF